MFGTMIQAGFVGSVTFMHYDFKLSLLVIYPMYLVASYYYSTATLNIDAGHMLSPPTQNEINGKINNELFCGGVIALSLVVFVYLVQKKTSELIIERI
jgi:hypothetical protein